MSHPESKPSSPPALPSNSTTTDPCSNNLGILRNPDGTITRLIQYPTTPPTPTPHPTTLSPLVLTKDLPLNPTHKTSIRIFLPHKHTNLYSSNKIPLIIYYHGGGFLYLSASSTINHNFCFKMAAQLPAVVASLDYRLAPEARLPAAYDDAVEALHCLKTTDEEWVREFCDFSSCFIMGSSSGGNIAYHVALRVSMTVDLFHPLKIKGLILHHPFFGGSRRTESELRSVNDPVLPLGSCDLLWELALPPGAGRDHRYCNPTVVDDDDEVCFDEIKRLGWKVLAVGCYGDPLIDRTVGLVEMLRRRGVEVVEHVGEGRHGAEFDDPNKEKLFLRVRNFIHHRS